MVPPRVQLCEGTGAGWLLPHPWGQGHSQRGQEPCALSQRCDCPQNSCTRVTTAGARPPARVTSGRAGAAEPAQTPPQSPQFLLTSRFRLLKKGVPGWLQPRPLWQKHGGSCPHGTGQGGDRSSCQLRPSWGHRPCGRTLDWPRTPGRGFVAPLARLCHPQHSSAEEFWEFRQSQTFLQVYNDP